jgi:DNA modification methylase
MKRHANGKNFKDMQKSFLGIDIPNPKIYADSMFAQESRIYPYYAGYAGSFAEAIIRAVGAPKTAVVFDPWNGSGTTTLAAAKLGYQAFGQDLNPVMVLVAKANLLPTSEASSLVPLAKAILKGSQRTAQEGPIEDPLDTWLTPNSARAIRNIESEINRSLVFADGYVHLAEKTAIDCVSSLAALFYVALFRTTRQLLITFIPSNPTWVKKPATPRNRKRPTNEVIQGVFLREVESLSTRLVSGIAPQEQVHASRIVLGNAESVELPDNSVDIVVTSPPYCTRIDYAIATSIELATLRITPGQFNSLRRSLMGTATVPTDTAVPSTLLGETCNNFLERVYQHPSKASKTYYYKNHIQYFNSLRMSIQEISRVLRKEGSAILVVQDSHYKEIKNDVAAIATEMAGAVGLSLMTKKEFPSVRSMAGINNRAMKYRQNSTAVESVLCFSRT